MSTTMDAELSRLQRLLKQIAKLAEHASLTGAFGGDGAVDVVEKYNLILDRLNNKGYDLGDLFPPLPQDASLDRVGIASNLLLAFIADEEPSASKQTPQIVIGHLGHLGELNGLKDLGKTIEESLPEWMRKKSEPVVADTPESSETETVKASADAIPMPDMSRTSA